MNMRKVGVTVLATACLLGSAQASYADEERDHAQLILVEAQRVAPNFVGVSNWLNSRPLSITDLRGKVVLVDFLDIRVHQLHPHAGIRHEIV